jgi:rod shape-determining protein MreD
LPFSIFIALFQSTVVARILILGTSPDLVLLFIVGWVLYRGLGEGIVVALVSGLVLDVLSGAPFGLRLVSLAVASSVVGIGELNVFRSAWFLPYVTVAIATLIYQCLFLFLASMMGVPVIWWPTMWRLVLPAVVVNTAFVPLVYGALGWLHRHSGPPTVEWR